MGNKEGDNELKYKELGSSTDLSIEDYILDNYEEGIKVVEGEDNERELKLVYLALFIITTLIPYITGIVHVLGESGEATESIENFLSGVLGYMSNSGVVIYVVFFWFLLFMGFVENVGYRIKKVKKGDLTEEDINNGYRLKIVEEFNKDGYDERIKYSYGDVNGVVDALMHEVLTKLNNAVELPTGYKTRFYELITFYEKGKGRGVYSLEHLEGDELEFNVNLDKIISTPKLNKDSVITWYKNISNKSKILSNLDYLEEVYQKQKKDEEIRLQRIRLEDEKRLRKEREAKFLSQRKKYEDERKKLELERSKNTKLREHSKHLLSEDRLNSKLEDSIRKVDKDTEEVVSETIRLIKGNHK